MSHADFAYSSPANDLAGLPLTLSVFANRAHLRDQMREDAEMAGFCIGQVAELDSLLKSEGRALGEVVLVDCPVIDGGTLAALVCLDLHVADAGTQLVVSTTVAALDDVFGCLDQSNPQILVDPSRAERVIALGRVLGRLPSHRVRDLSEDDRLGLLRLTEQVGQIAERLDRLSSTSPDERPEEYGAFRFESPKQGSPGPESDSSERLIRAARPGMPDPRLVRRIIRQRQLRGRFFDADLFADPAWDILLDLTAARAEHSRVSVTSLCIASAVPPTTALRWIGQMIDSGLLARVEDETDRRRAFITLTDKAADAMARYFAELGQSAVRTV